MSISLKFANQNHAAKIVEVRLKIGEMRDFVETITQKYWDYISHGTIAQGARIKFHLIPATAICQNCETVFPYAWHSAEKTICPVCHESNLSLHTGTELEVEEIAII